MTPPDPSKMAIATVLVVDEDTEFLERMVQIGREKLIHVARAHSEEQLLEQARRAHLDAALINIQFGAIDYTWSEQPGEFAYRLARLLRSIEGMADLPLAFLSTDDRVFDRVAAAHAGGSLFLTKPVTPSDFVEAVRHLTAGRERERPRLLIVDDDEDHAAPLIELLNSEGMDVRHLPDPSRILDVLADLRPDLLLLDVVMPVLNGFDVCRMLRSSPQWRDLPILLLTAKDDAAHRVAAFEAGADDYLSKPYVREELIARVRARLERARMQRDRADRDALTGLLLRRPFTDMVGARLAEARRRDIPLSLCLLDLDHFKQVNDTYGHLAGDRVLTAIGKLLSRSFRTEDVRGRWGGEEFCVAFHGERSEIAREILGRARDEFRRIEFRGDHGETFHVGFSAGISCFPADGEDLEELLRAADRRLYTAKDLGRGRTVVTDGPEHRDTGELIAAQAEVLGAELQDMGPDEDDETEVMLPGPEEHEALGIPPEPSQPELEATQPE